MMALSMTVEVSQVVEMKIKIVSKNEKRIKKITKQSQEHSHRCMEKGWGEVWK